MKAAHLPFMSPMWIITAVVTILARFFVTGRPVTGRPDDNATWLRDATEDYRHRPAERLTRARWRRVARRWALLGIPTLLLLLAGSARLTATLWHAAGHPPPAWAGWPWLPLAAAYASCALLLAACAAVKALMAAIPTRVEREYSRPAWQVVCKILGERYRPGDARRIELPSGFGQENDGEKHGEAPELVARIHLPVAPLDSGVRERVVRAAGERLGIASPVGSWTVKGATAFVDLTPKALPPRKLAFADVRAHIEQADPRKPFVGIAAGGRIVTADLDNDGPHIGVSGGTGTGKSTLVATVLAQRVRAGAGLVVCDFKVISQPWARRIAQEDPMRVVYAVDIPEISNVILEVFGEFNRRRELLKGSPSALESLRDIDLMVEEVNTLASYLRDWWKGEGRQEHADACGIAKADAPTVATACTALAALVQMGRELGIRIHFAAQRLDAASLAPSGGGAVRESITNRFLAKYSRQTWDMLCRGVPYEAFPGGPRGIWTAVVSDTVTHFRVPNVDRGERGQMYAFAMGGPAPTVPILGSAPALAGAERRAVVTAVKLSDALEHLPRFGTLDALRKSVQREGIQPIGQEGNAHTFDLDVLRARWGRELDHAR